MRLDIRDKFPSGMEEYLSQNGWHFNKVMCEWAASRMYRKVGSGKEKISGFTKESLETLFKVNNTKLDTDFPYDAVYAANMCKADYSGSSIPDDYHLVKFVQDYINDIDGYEGMPFTRFYADCIGSGIAIPWEDVI